MRSDRFAIALIPLLALLMLAGCGQSPRLPGKIVADHSVYTEPGLVLYEKGRLRNLGAGGSHPRLVGDGGTIAYAWGKSSLKIRLLSYSTGKIRNDFPIPNLTIHYAFTPDRLRVVYASRKSIEEGIAENLHLYDLKRKDGQQLTSYENTKAGFDSIEIAPDGRWVIYAWREGHVEFPDGHSDGLAANIYRMNLETSATEALFKGRQIDLSSNGKRLVFITGEIGGEKFGTSDLVIYDFETEQFTRLTQSEGMIFKRSPRFSPDGKWVAYIEERPGRNNRALVAVKTDGSGEKHTIIKPGKYVLNSLDWGP